MGEISKTILTSRDGARVCQVNRFIERSKAQNRHALIFTYEVQFGPKAGNKWLNVLLGGMVLEKMDPSWYGREGDEDANPHLVALCRIGDWLEECTAQPSEAPNESLEVLSYYLGDLKERQPADDSEIRSYMGAKTWWAHKFNRTWVEFREVDELRLNAETADFIRVARRHPEYWTIADATGEMFEFSHQILKDWERGRFPGRIVSPIYHVGGILREERYAGPRSHFEKAVEHFAGENKDTANSVKEAASALESMLKVVTGQKNASVSQMASQIQTAKLVHPALLEMLKKVWGYASAKPGSRHAGSGPPEENENEAQFVLTTVAAALVMLREVDPG